MISLSLECRESESEFLSAELWEHGASGLQEEDLTGGRVRLRAWFDSSKDLAGHFSAFTPVVREEEPVDWEQVSRQAWQPVKVGSRFYLAPEWDQSETPMGLVRLTVHPGMASGTGDHPATRLALAAMAGQLLAGECMLDVGTGTGILLAAAYLLGSRGAGCDIDFESARTARHNLMQDAHPPHVFAGSLRAIAPNSADVVVANINAATHQTLAAEYARVARRLIILTGFPERHEAAVEQSLLAYGWHPAGRLTDREWVCLSLSRALDSPRS
jgi:ribosomal protein L11 methyltransferase